MLPIMLILSHGALTFNTIMVTETILFSVISNLTQQDDKGENRAILVCLERTTSSSSVTHLSDKNPVYSRDKPLCNTDQLGIRLFFALSSHRQGQIQDFGKRGAVWIAVNC